MFVFSTNTNNVPVSTNTILAIGPSGQMVASNTLYNLSTYGVGYLPSTLSSLNGEIISVGNLVLAGGVTPGQLTSVQTALQSSISSTQGSVDTLSSYVLLNVIPSTVSTFDSQVSSLNSSFQGYVAGASVTPGQLASTYTAATTYTDQQISTLSTNTAIQISTLSNYFDVSSATVTQFSTLAGNVSAQSNYFSTQLYITNSNFNALSTSTRLLNESNSTLIGGLEEEVSTLSNIVVTTSTVTTPLGTLGLLSTSQCANWPFFSNIKVSSIDVRAAGTAAAPALSFTSGSDTDTGIYHPADGTIAFTTNSGERLRIQGNATFGSTYINLYGSSNGSAALNPFNYPVLALTSGCNDNGNAARIEYRMPSTGFITYCGGETGGGGYAYRQLTTYAYDYAGTTTINKSFAIHSTGNCAIKDDANGSNALYVNGSTFINGQLGVSAAGSAAAPALYFSETGNDTGFFKPGDGILAVTANGTESYRFSGAEFGGSNSRARTLLDYATRANIELASSCNDNIYAPYILMCNANTGVGFQTWCGGSTDSVPLGFTDQLVTRAYPSGVDALAIASNGSVGIGGLADPTFALTVSGSVRQTVPLIWEYFSANSYFGPSANQQIIFTSSNYEPAGIGTILFGSGTAIVPYNGTYTITGEAQALGINGVNLDLYINGTLIKTAYTNNNSYLNLSLTTTLTVGNSIYLFIQRLNGQILQNAQLRVQYWG